MSVILLNTTVAWLRAQLAPKDVPTVQAYGGEFSAAEVGKLSFSAPAVLVAPLGWRSSDGSGRVRGKHARSVRMAAFVVTKHARREDRMLAAMALSEQLGLLLRNWVPDDAALPLAMAPLDEPPTAENLYGRAIDEQGLALWLVDWTQDVSPKPGADAQLYDLLRVDIEDTTQQGQVPAPAPGPTGLVVTEDVTFNKPL